MHPETVQELVTTAFCLEVIADKPGCTTRYVDLPDKPFHDFIIAAINSGKFFRKLAFDVFDNRNPSIFKYFVPALSEVNLHKSSKTINFGLLEVMFATVYARLQCNDKQKIIDKIVDVMKKESPEDVQNLLAARKIAWKSSTKSYKKDFSGEQFQESKSPYEFYMALMQKYDNDTGHHQWANQFKQGLPILKAFFDDFMHSKSLLDNIKFSYQNIREKYPNIKIGIVADMCAAALFLSLSFK